MHQLHPSPLVVFPSSQKVPPKIRDYLNHNSDLLKSELYKEFYEYANQNYDLSNP